MKDIFEKQSSSSPQASNYASSSGLSGDDKEIGYRASITSKHPYLLAKNSYLLHFLSNKIDRNFARMVIVYWTLLSLYRVIYSSSYNTKSLFFY